MRILALIAAALLGAGQFLPAQDAMPARAEAIFINGVIYTGVGLGDDRPETVEAMAIGGGKVLAVGSNNEVLRLKEPQTRVRDLMNLRTGVVIFPGFNDAHLHLGDAGSIRMNLDLTGTRSEPAMMARVAAFARQLPPGHWITGGNWDQTLWPGKTLPARQQLDRVTAGHPAFLQRIDGHIALANSAALAAAGLTGKTSLPAGGAVDLDAQGRLTGIVRESAQGLVEKKIPASSPAERRRGLELAIADALANGVTSVQDFSTWEDFLVYEKMEQAGKLNLRISEWIPFAAPLDVEERYRAHHAADDPMLHTGMLKGFMDGSLGARTAALKQPYADDPGNRGLPQYTPGVLNPMAVARTRAGFQLGFHAIGDQAVAMALDAIAQAEEQTWSTGPCRAPGQPAGVWDEKLPCAGAGPRHRIEHAQVVDPADIPRFVRLGVIASVQPCHLLTDMNWAEARLGPERAAQSYPWKALLDAGVPLAFGTDYPVEPVSPFRGLYAAVTRMNEAGTKTYYPENEITRGQALYAYTQGSAYAEHAEKSKGMLAPGYDADFILVDRDLYSVPAPDLLHARVLETFVAGRQVFLAKARIQ